MEQAVKQDDTRRKIDPTVKLVDEARAKQQAYEVRKAERDEARRHERAKAKAEKLALINCIEMLIKGIKGEIDND